MGAKFPEILGYVFGGVLLAIGLGLQFNLIGHEQKIVGSWLAVAGFATLAYLVRRKSGIFSKRVGADLSAAILARDETANPSFRQFARVVYVITALIVVATLALGYLGIFNTLLNYALLTSMMLSVALRLWEICK